MRVQRPHPVSAPRSSVLGWAMSLVVVVVVAACLVGVRGAAAVGPYVGIGASAATLKHSGVIGARAGYENDTFLSSEAHTLASWPEAVTERDFFYPKKVLPRLPGTSYRVIWGATSGIVLGIRLIGIQTKPAISMFRRLMPPDAELDRQQSKPSRCTGWAFSSASLTTAVTAIAAQESIDPAPSAIHVHVWWTAPRAAYKGNVYLELSTSGTPSC
jgi:hypothetical protein